MELSLQPKGYNDITNGCSFPTEKYTPLQISYTTPLLQKSPIHKGLLQKMRGEPLFLVQRSALTRTDTQLKDIARFCNRFPNR